MFKKLALAAALVAVAGTAGATGYNIGNLAADEPLSFSASTAGAIDDLLTFHLIGGGTDFSGTLLSTFTGSKTIGSFAATLSGPGGYSSSWTAASIPGVNTQFLNGKATSLTAGTYTLHVTGAGQPKDSYALDLSIAAVPEPETYALMLAGLGVVGFIAKRRKA